MAGMGGVGGGWGGGWGGRTFPILYITTPDQPPHGSITGSRIVVKSKNCSKIVVLKIVVLKIVVKIIVVR